MFTPVAKPAGVNRRTALLSKKPPPLGRASGDGFSQYETTDDPMWPRPEAYFLSEKPALG